MFATISAFTDALGALPDIDQARITQARAHQNTLTKPPGSLGRLEDLACFLAGWQSEGPRAEQIDLVVFAGNHGVTAQGVSPYPAEVTAQMVTNFERGGAAINALTRSAGLNLKVVPLDLAHPTGDITETEAMSAPEFLAALNAGADVIDPSTDILAVGEMGIGNTTIAAALAAALFGGQGLDWAGAGTGLDAKGINRKAAVIDRALSRHAAMLTDPITVMRVLGGRELAAIAGAVTRARQLRIPVLLDGFITAAAVAPLFRHNSKSLDHCLAGHRSHERGHGRLLEAMGLAPILDLGLRLGEGSGAALAASILRGAVAIHRQMASFAEAGVSETAGLK